MMVEDWWQIHSAKLYLKLTRVWRGITKKVVDIYRREGH